MNINSTQVLANDEIIAFSCLFFIFLGNNMELLVNGRIKSTIISWYHQFINTTAY